MAISVAKQYCPDFNSLIDPLRTLQSFDYFGSNTDQMEFTISTVSDEVSTRIFFRFDLICFFIVRNERKSSLTSNRDIGHHHKAFRFGFIRRVMFKKSTQNNYIISRFRSVASNCHVKWVFSERSNWQKRNKMVKEPLSKRLFLTSH